MIIALVFCFPRNILIEYSPRIFKPNILYFKHPDKFIEDIVNNLYGDNLL